MRVVITGATGNVGTSVIDALGTDEGVDSVLGLARRVPRWPAAKTEWAQADVRQDDLVLHLRGADVLINLAWQFQPTHEPVTTWRSNVEGGIRTFRAAADAGVRTIVHASSQCAYSPGPKDRPVDESWPTNGWPSAAYAREKAYLERVLDTFEYEHPETRVVRLRTSFIFKREAATEQRRLIAGPLLPEFLFRLGRIPAVPDLPELRFQAVHSTDAAWAYQLATTRDVHGAYNIAAEPVLGPTHLAEFLQTRTIRLPARLLRVVLDAAWHLRILPTSPELFDALLQFPIMDTSRARTKLEWAPRYSALDAVRAFVDGLRERADKNTSPLAQRTGVLRRRGFTGDGEQGS